MRQVTASGQTVEEAVQSALEQLNTTRDHVEIEVIDEGKRGILGVFGSKRAFVKVTLAKNQVQEAEKFLKDVVNNMNVEVNIHTTVEDNHVTFDLSGEKIALLIGKRGQTLNAIQYLVHLVINKDGKKFYTVTVDAEGYRGRRRETLESLANRMAEKALRINKKVALEPMPAYERKIIHSVLQARDDVSTYSDGTEPHRHIVIKP
ncbi:RNA-binding cell elongation regulator Jag/EloR [Ornithinibacillus halophilus]|uniref:RNA-binding protein KhpB n=1 Tax=Ornithinibacillus halophilus TaxID=930117 RepID=A0A1M5M640_9BACI|nr:RNA-binding cell elongation regulator Jag/EloR [Ornithinibacillus halophilus]SHG72668.1 spoIIIJ-associated protein [Ornithinibacillus halophilus]